MKKLVAISLLFLHLFSLYGHLALYEYFVYKSDKIFDQQISMDRYAVDDLVSVKLPVSMPSIDDWKDYSYISGVIKFQDNSYNYVKMRMTRDTLYLMCIPNYKKTRLLNQNVIDARNIADIPASKKDHVPFGKLSALSEFNYQLVSYRFLMPVSHLDNKIHHTSAILITRCKASPVQPPEAARYLS